MTKSKPAAERDNPGSEPGSDVTPPVLPPDNNGDGQPGGSDALEPYAVLLEPHAGIDAGKIVYGPAAAVAALVDASAARMATPDDLAIAGVHVHALPA